MVLGWCGFSRARYPCKPDHPPFAAAANEEKQQKSGAFFGGEEREAVDLIVELVISKLTILWGS